MPHPPPQHFTVRNHTHWAERGVFDCVFERERNCVSVCVCMFKREIVCVHVCGTERERGSLFVSVSVWLFLCVRVSVRVTEKERTFVCFCLCLCVCVVGGVGGVCVGVGVWWCVWV